MTGRLDIGIDAEGIVVGFDTSEQLVIGAQPVSVDHQFFESGDQPALHPAGRMENEIGAAHNRRVHAVGAFGGSLSVGKFGCDERTTAA